MNRLYAVNIHDKGALPLLTDKLGEIIVIFILLEILHFPCLKFSFKHFFHLFLQNFCFAWIGTESLQISPNKCCLRYKMSGTATRYSSYCYLSSVHNKKMCTKLCISPFFSAYSSLMLGPLLTLSSWQSSSTFLKAHIN